MTEAEAIELLEATHDFPCVYPFRAFARPGTQTVIVTAVTAAGGDRLRIAEVRERTSRKGNWISLHIDAHVDDAATVLAVNSVFQQLDEVVLTL